MSKRKSMEFTDTGPESRPMRTPEGRDSEMIALSYDLVAERMRRGTASSMETTFFLKLAAQRERAELEKELIQKKIELMQAQKEAQESAKRIEELYMNAVNSVSSYRSSIRVGQEEDRHE